MPLPHIPAVSLSAETELVAQLNAFRVAEDQETLVFANGPTQASRRHAADMAFNGVRDFTGSDGSNPGQRMRDTCYEWVTVGQIIGWGFADPGEMAQFWINSPVHRDLLLDSRYDDLGPGYAYNEESDWQHYWSVTLAQPSGPRIRSAAAGAGYSCSVETRSARGGSRLTWNQESPCPT